METWSKARKRKKMKGKVKWRTTMTIKSPWMAKVARISLKRVMKKRKRRVHKLKERMMTMMSTKKLHRLTQTSSKECKRRKKKRRRKKEMK